MRDAFAVLFFVSIGMLLDPGGSSRKPALVLAALGVRAPRQAAGGGAHAAGDALPAADDADGGGARSARSASSRSSSPRLRRDLGIIPASAINIVVAVSIISITMNPVTSRLVDRLERWIAAADAGCGGRCCPVTRTSARPGPPRRWIRRDRAVVIGHGPTGRTVTRLLRENGISPTVVELNMDTVRTMRQEGCRLLYGDAPLHSADAHLGGPAPRPAR